jgi:hypothetical protein
MVIDGEFDQAFSDQLYEHSPFHDDPFGGRTDKFWMTSHPAPVTDSGFQYVLGLWDGESASFVHIEGTTGDALARIGRGRILEVAVPLRVTNHASSP